MPYIRKSSSALRSSLVAVAILQWTAPARAGGPLGPEGSRITTSEYAVDLFQGPVFAGTRVTGLAGAYVAIAEEVDGDLQNPATPAVRPFYSYSHFDYWLGFGLTFPATLKNTDFFNSGSTTHIANAPDSFVFVVPAVNLQWGEFAVGLTVEVQNYAISNPPTPDTATRAISVTIPTTHLQFAHGFARNQLVAGVGARFVTMSLSGPERERSSFQSNGTGLDFGAVWKPENYPLRLGLALRTAIRTDASYGGGLFPDENSDLVVRSGTDTIYLPKAVAFPWDLNFGFAVQFGKRPFNPPWHTSGEMIERRALIHRLREMDRQEQRDRELATASTREERAAIEQRFNREQRADDRRLGRDLWAARQRIERRLLALNRFYVQIAASALVSGPVVEGVGVESLVQQTVARSGEHSVISMRLGVESGVIPEYLKVRAGTYLEPTRFQGSTARLHGTLGFDVKLAVWNVFGLWPDDYMWKLGLAGDVAHRYYMWGVTIGGWYPRHKSETELPVSEREPWSLPER